MDLAGEQVSSTADTVRIRTLTREHNGHPRGAKPLHPVTVWRGRLALALDALDTASTHNADDPEAQLQRIAPVETTAVLLPTGDRLQIPTGAETLRLKGYLIMCRNSRRDYTEFADLVDTLDPHTAAMVLSDIDRYYCGQRPGQQWVATELVRRLADPNPGDEDTEEPGAEADWNTVKRRCLTVAVAMLEESR